MLWSRLFKLFFVVRNENIILHPLVEACWIIHHCCPGSRKINLLRRRMRIFNKVTQNIVKFKYFDILGLFLLKKGCLLRLTNKGRFEWHRQNSSNTLLTKTNKVSFSSLEYRLCMVNFWASNVCFQRSHRAWQVGATDLPKSLNRHISKHGPDTDTLPWSEM